MTAYLSHVTPTPRPNRQILLPLVFMFVMSLVPASQAAPSGDNLETALTAALGLDPAAGGRVDDHGQALRRFIAEGYVARQPTRRVGYTDYRALLKPFHMLGQTVVALEEEYFLRFVGCCVDEGLGVIFRLSGPRDALAAFADTNKCSLSIDQRDVRAHMREAGLDGRAGQFARLSCRMQDARRAAAPASGAPPALPVAAQPLPRRPDIAPEVSNILCPDEAAARRMMEDYVAHDRASEGYGATGCHARTAGSAPIRIAAVIHRFPVERNGQTVVFMLYRGADASGVTMVGLVDEGLNDGMPRTPLDRFLAANTRNGLLVADAPGLAYVCGAPERARRVIDAIADARHRSLPAAGQKAAFTAALAAEGCHATSSAFRIVAVHGTETIDLGPEAEDDWTALTARDTRDHTIGLVFNESPYGRP